MLIVFNRESLLRFRTIIKAHQRAIPYISFFPDIRNNSWFFFERYYEALHLFGFIADSTKFPTIAPRIKPSEEWTLDSHGVCEHCKDGPSHFNFFKRRHHCRQCGHLVCDACSPHREWLRAEKAVQITIEQRVRICESCCNKNYSISEKPSVVARYRAIIFYHILYLVHKKVLHKNECLPHQDEFLKALYSFQTGDVTYGDFTYTDLWQHVLAVKSQEGKPVISQMTEDELKPYQWLLLMPDVLEASVIEENVSNLARVIVPLIIKYIKKNLEKQIVMLDNIILLKLAQTPEGKCKEAWKTVFIKAITHVITQYSRSPNPNNIPDYDQRLRGLLESLDIFSSSQQKDLLTLATMALKSDFESLGLYLLTSIHLSTSQDILLIIGILKPLLIKYILHNEKYLTLKHIINILKEKPNLVGCRAQASVPTISSVIEDIVGSLKDYQNEIEEIDSRLYHGITLLMPVSEDAEAKYDSDIKHDVEAKHDSDASPNLASYIPQVCNAGLYRTTWVLLARIQIDSTMLKEFVMVQAGFNYQLLSVVDAIKQLLVFYVRDSESDKLALLQQIITKQSLPKTPEWINIFEQVIFSAINVLERVLQDYSQEKKLSAGELDGRLSKCLPMFLPIFEDHNFAEKHIIALSKHHLTGEYFTETTKFFFNSIPSIFGDSIETIIEIIYKQLIDYILSKEDGAFHRLKNSINKIQLKISQDSAFGPQVFAQAMWTAVNTISAQSQPEQKKHAEGDNIKLDIDRRLNRCLAEFICFFNDYEFQPNKFGNNLVHVVCEAGLPTTAQCLLQKFKMVKADVEVETMAAIMVRPVQDFILKKQGDGDKVLKNIVQKQVTEYSVGYWTNILEDVLRQAVEGSKGCIKSMLDRNHISREECNRRIQGMDDRLHGFLPDVLSCCENHGFMIYQDRETLVHALCKARFAYSARWLLRKVRIKLDNNETFIISITHMANVILAPLFKEYAVDNNDAVLDELKAIISKQTINSTDDVKEYWADVIEKCICHVIDSNREKSINNPELDRHLGDCLKHLIPDFVQKKPRSSSNGALSYLASDTGLPQTTLVVLTYFYAVPSTNESKKHKMICTITSLLIQCANGESSAKEQLQAIIDKQITDESKEYWQDIFNQSMYATIDTMAASQQTTMLSSIQQIGTTLSNLFAEKILNLEFTMPNHNNEEGLLKFADEQHLSRVMLVLLQRGVITVEQLQHYEDSIVEAITLLLTQYTSIEQDEKPEQALLSTLQTIVDTQFKAENSKEQGQIIFDRAMYAVIQQARNTIGYFYSNKFMPKMLEFDGYLSTCLEVFYFLFSDCKQLMLHDKTETILHLVCEHGLPKTAVLLLNTLPTEAILPRANKEDVSRMERTVGYLRENIGYQVDSLIRSAREGITIDNAAYPLNEAIESATILLKNMVNNVGRHQDQTIAEMDGDRKKIIEMTETKLNTMIATIQATLQSEIDAMEDSVKESSVQNLEKVMADANAKLKTSIFETKSLLQKKISNPNQIPIIEDVRPTPVSEAVKQIQELTRQGASVQETTAFKDILEAYIEKLNAIKNSCLKEHSQSQRGIGHGRAISHFSVDKYGLPYHQLIEWLEEVENTYNGIQRALANVRSV